ncbi:MAG: hypothetical protein Q8M03_11735 [Legionella sp.]|nr:hypothetical protein [Legionella sp.]
MDLRRYTLSVLMVVFSFFNFAFASAENFGIALVHGTNDHRIDAEGGYWKKEFITLLTNSLPNPDNHVVVACDYSQSMWHEDAAGCTADQLLTFIDNKKITKLVVYTHSDGANIIRWILSNPTYDPRFLELGKKIINVVAISPSSGGTPLADEATDGSILFEAIGWLIGYRNDSVLQQRVGDMALYNDELLLGTPGRPSLPVPFRVIVSSDVTASPFSSASYCNGYTLNAGLKIAKLYLESCADGFLNCRSQNIAGTTWFYDIERTQDRTPLSHNQSRHNCFGLETILKNDLVELGVSQ